MRYRLLGPTGLRVSELFFGGTIFAAGGDAASRAVFEAYADAGGNVVDTAAAYGESEAVLGELLRGRRDRFVVATKYSMSRDSTDPNAAGNHRKNLRLTLERSLRRLDTDHVDLLWVHLWDRLTPIEETMRALDDVVRQGKVLYVGFSNVPAWVAAQAGTLARWRGWSPPVALQAPYNLLWRDIERELLPMAEACGLTVATWRTMAMGVLGGRPDDAGTERERAAALALRQAGDELGATPAQVAIAWARARSRAVHPILGVSSVGQLAENLAAVELDLPAGVIERLDAAVPFERGYPADFLAECEGPDGAFGSVAQRVDGRSHPG
jgi:aryl-alcohol dehydrogenase-like predicted oxidoreductase